MRILLSLILFVSVSEFARCAEILAVVPSPFFSHQATFRPLWLKLAERGHKLTLITTDPMEPNENITQINYNGSYTIMNNKIGGVLKSNYNLFSIVLEFINASDEFMTYQFNHPGLMELLNSKKKFDLMLVELLMPGWPLLSVKFGCPFIGLSTMDGHQNMHAAVGNAIHPAIYPYADLGIGENPSLKDRLASTAFVVMSELVLNNAMSYIGNKYARTYIDKDLPDVRDVFSNVSMIFINSNPIFFPPRPVTPVTVNMGGGLHLKEPKKLEKDLQKYLDESKHGCIYVSFGTTVNSAYLSAEQKEIFTSVFKDMAPMRILWKFDEVNIANKPKNVEIRKWLPQQDVLRHPNLKAFITQGGLQSMEEAIDSAVPMLGMPFYGDQNNNVNKMAHKKFGLKLSPKEMTKETLKAALKEVLENPIYKKNIDKLSAISKDQPMKGLEKAVWWTEYVLRHGTQHLRSPSADIPLYQYYFLDVIAVLAICAYVMYKLTKYLFLSLVNVVRKLFNCFIVKKKKE
ncbi:UDP-glycosyltransferase UGT5-like isoform X2 [Harmonia axyridis]|uniref:UDP-glycosyltransferase UGT5-like isoform X2 n=1 Tax=Harmonia axyridis TaxID=115357 RepID=UPI001E276D13|nr:UDP-glycosyltransferase UGT5-like isoform X2 [Harmonia axyridis]